MQNITGILKNEDINILQDPGNVLHNRDPEE